MITRYGKVKDYEDAVASMAERRLDTDPAVYEAAKTEPIAEGVDPNREELSDLLQSPLPSMPSMMPKRFPNSHYK